MNELLKQVRENKETLKALREQDDHKNSESYEKIRRLKMIKHEDKDRESIAEDKKVILNTPHYAVEVKETDEGVIIDVFHRHGELIDTYTYWNDDVIDKDGEHEND